MNTEILATSAVKEAIASTDLLSPFINEGDKEPSWDGNIYAQRTGDKEPLDAYVKKHNCMAADAFMGAASQMSKGDNMYFFLAYASAFLELQTNMLNQHEKDLVRGIRSSLQLTAVKVTIPPNMRGRFDEAAE